MSLNESQKHNVKYLMKKLGLILIGGNEQKKVEGYDKFKTSFESDELA